MTLLAVRSFRFKHNLGQNFLKEDVILEEIVRLSGCEKQDRVLEIGAGAGTLTRYLLQNSAKVLAVEIDPDLIAFLREVLPSDSLTLYQGDILKMKLETELASWTSNQPYRLVSNLPYYITTEILEKICTLIHKPKSMTLMVQKEAAHRLLSKVGDKEYGPLPILLSYYYEGKEALSVPASNFDPAPHIDSVVLQFERSDMDRRYPCDETALMRLITTSFRMRRKTLVNNLVPAYFSSKEDAIHCLTSLGFSEKIRAERLTFEDYYNLLAFLKG